MSDKSALLSWRRMAWVALLALPAFVGCRPPVNPDGLGPEETYEPPAFVPVPMLRALGTLQAQDSRWETLQARCKITIYHPRLTPPIDDKLAPIRFESGALYIDKGPVRRQEVSDAGTKVRGYLVRLDFGASNVVVSDGKMYMGRIAELGVRFQGLQGDRPHALMRADSPVVREVDIPLAADDIVFGLEPLAALRGLPLIIRQSATKLELMGLGMMATAESSLPGRETRTKLTLKRGVVMNPGDKMVRWVYRYDSNGFPWSMVLIRKREDVIGVLKTPVQIPSTIWMRYPQTGAVVQIDLTEIKLGVPIAPSRFKLDSTIHTGGDR
jgi:hypothetical protein